VSHAVVSRAPNVSGPAGHGRTLDDVAFFTAPESAAKRALDVLLVGGGLLITSLAWLVLAALVKAEDGGPIFYGQERVGKGGRRFKSWKFRSMRPLENHDGPLLQANLEEHRITRIGKLMRATALDELPQLWNIFVGDMSLVGPRAILPEEVVGEGEAAVSVTDVAGYAERHSIRPGLTGLSQVYLARDVSHRHKFRVDCLYVRRRSFGLDLKLIAMSVWVSLRGAWPEIGKE
jgi:lipopolysaccharide/colanic/teichoic acid biosynthesis glycosyltransferase